MMTTSIRRLTLFIFLLQTALDANSQEVKPDSLRPATPPTAPARKDQRPLAERISVGGSTGFWIQPKKTHLEVAGLIAYRFPKILIAGPGYRYIYTRNRVYGKDLNSYGPNIFARAQVTKRIYLWTEWERLKTEYVVQVANNEIATETAHAESFFGGLGYIRRIGRKGRGGLSIQVLYNFLYDKENNSPYYSPVIYRVGYFF
jgi:hypothetical protein